MDDLLSLLHGQFLPEGNRLACSLHLLRGMLGVHRPRVFECHACSCEKYWPPCPKQQWATTEHGKCPYCQGERLKTVAQQHGGTQLVPAGKVRVGGAYTQPPSVVTPTATSLRHPHLTLQLTLTHPPRSALPPPPVICAEVLGAGPM